MARRSRSAQPRLRIAIVGRGRTGTSLAKAWRSAGHRVSLVSHQHLGAVKGSPIVVLAVPDRAVATTAGLVTRHLGTAALVIHTAGSLDLTPLEGARVAGAQVASLHPLLAISRPGTDLTGGYAAVDGPPRFQPLLRRLARDAGLIPLPRAPRDRVRYHLAAALAANSIAPLLETAVEQMRDAGIPPKAARPALARLTQSALEAWARQGGPEGLTGPVARGDAPTVARHLNSLGDAATRQLYLALAESAAKLAAQRKPAPEGLGEVRRLIEQARRS